MNHPTEASPNYWQTIIDNLHESVITTDPDGIIVSWNKGAERLFGYSADEVIGRHVEICHTQSREDFTRNMLTPLLRDGQFQQFGVMVRKSGDTFDGHLRTSLITAPDGTVTGTVGYVVDASDHGALKVSEQNLRTISRLSPVGIHRLNSSGFTVYVNESWWQILDRDPEKNSADDWPQWLHPDDKEAVLTNWRAAVDGNLQYSRECRMVMPDGSSRWVLAQATPELDAAGVGTGFVASLTDIHRQKETERALAESEERLSLALQGGNDGLWDWNLETGTVYRSPRYLEILGYDAGELGDTDADRRSLIHPEDWAKVEAFWARLKSDDVDTTSEVESRFRHKDGSYVDVATRGYAVRNNAGEAIRIAGMSTDISRRKQAERALAESEERLSFALKGSNDGLWDWDLASGEVYRSPRYLDILGYEAGEISNVRAERKALIHPEDLPTVDKFWTELMSAIDSVCEVECRMRRKDGSYVEVVSRGLTERDGDGQPVRIAGLLTDISRRKRAERALAESEERLTLAMQGSNDGLWDWDLVAGEIYRSPRHLEILGYEPNELSDMKTNGGELAHPDDLPRLDNFWSQLSDGSNDSREVECRLRRNDSSYVDVKLRGLGVSNEKGKLIRIAGMTTDISRRRSTERALAKSEERFALAMRGANDGLWDWDMVTGDLYLSPRYREILGYGLDDVLDDEHRGYPLVHPEDRKRVIAYFSKLGDGEDAGYEIEHRMRRADGRYLDVVSRGFAIRDDSGKPVRQVGTITDISARRIAESELLAVRAQAESERRVRLAFENVTVGNIVITPEGIIEMFNSAAEQMFGYTAEEAIGQNISMLMPEPDRAKHDSYVRAYMESGKKKVIGTGREVIGRRKNGEEFPMHVGVGEMIIGDETSFVGSVTDLSDVKHLEQQLRHSQRLEAVGQLTGGIAHDFNNLLGIILGNVELLEDLVGEGADVAKRIESIVSATARGASLTRRLLAFSRNQALSPVSTDTVALIRGLEDMLQRTLGETIVLSITTGMGLGPVIIDPHQFEDALVNLAINARDAMPNGGELKIGVAPAHLAETYVRNDEKVAMGNYVVVSVTDTGTGMPSDVREKAFEPFFTTKDVGKGSGLGLSMVYGFAKQTGGHITIDSHVGHGTTIKLYLPRSDSARVENAVDDNFETTTLKGSERILVVEDDDSLREIATSLLRDHGYQVIAANDGQQAIERLKEGLAFDLLFTDVVLPNGASDIQVAAEAKRRHPDLKVVYTTGYAEHSIAHGAVLGPDAVKVRKPYRQTEVLEKIRTLLDDEATRSSQNLSPIRH
jgi:PAS domain S-box-containing protein